MEVENPFQTGRKVLCVALSNLFTVDVDPFNALSYLKGPSMTLVLGSPFLCNGRNQLAACINLQQTIHQAAQALKVLALLGVQNVKTGNLLAGYLWDNQIFDLFSLFLFFCLFLLALFRLLCLLGGSFRIFLFFGSCAAAATGQK